MTLGGRGRDVMAARSPPHRTHVPRAAGRGALACFGVRVGLIAGTVQPEADGAVSFAAIRAAGEQVLYLLDHRCPVSLTDLIGQSD